MDISHKVQDTMQRLSEVDGGMKQGESGIWRGYSIWGGVAIRCGKIQGCFMCAKGHVWVLNKHRATELTSWVSVLTGHPGAMTARHKSLTY